MKRGLWCLGRPVWLPVSGYLVCCAAPGGGLDLGRQRYVLSSLCSAGLLGSKSDTPESWTGPGLTRGCVTALFFRFDIVRCAWVPASRWFTALTSSGPGTRALAASRFFPPSGGERCVCGSLGSKSGLLAAALPSSSDFVSQTSQIIFFFIRNFFPSLYGD